MKMNSRRALEVASKTNHTHIINDPEVAKFLKDCEDIPRDVGVSDFDDKAILCELEELQENPIKSIIAVDGGYNEVEVNKRFPASRLAYFQFGALFFDLEHLENLEKKPFLFPEDMAKFKKLERIKLVLPTRHISYKCNTLLHSIRQTIFEFFSASRNGETYIETLKWFLFQEYDPASERGRYVLASCPHPDCDGVKIPIKKKELVDYKCQCTNCQREIFLTDAFRLHEAIDEEFGAGGILGYLTNLIEQVIILHNIRYILKKKPKLLKEILFIKDGPLAFFGQTANMHKPMRNLCNYLLDKHNLYLAGLEKSGAFVDHADLICSPLVNGGEPILEPGKVLLLSNEYIYTYIMPGIPDPEKPYAGTSYYGSKLIYHTEEGNVYVATLPVADKFVVNKPTKDKFRNIDVILRNISKLRCDMYENSLVPIALVNQLVSLANRPSSVLLEKFSRGEVG